MHRLNGKGTSRFPRTVLFIFAVIFIAWAPLLAQTTYALEIHTATGQGAPIAGISVYAFTAAGAYTGNSAVTDAQGTATFDAAAFGTGSYRFRGNYLGYQFWTADQAVEAETVIDLTIPHRDCTVTVGVDYPTEGVLSGVPVYLFTEAGAYMGRSLTTGADGTVVFSLPDRSYKVRADYLGGRFWSDPFQSADTSVTVPMAAAAITVSGMGEPLSGVNIYAFTAAGSYLGLTGTTNTAGQIAFTLPAGSYKFRADYQGARYWSDETALIAGQNTAAAISTGGGLLEVVVTKSDATPMSGVNCYAFTEAGSYLGLTDATDAAGEVSFALSDGTYKIRADYLGYRFWTDVITVPDTLSSTLAIPHRDCTVTVGVDYPAAGVLENFPVYLFTEAGAYMGRSLTTGADGTVVFSLPDRSYKVRADYLGGRFWSDPFQFADASVTVPMATAAITVTGMGEPLSGVNVYAFTAAGSYLGQNGATNDAGQISFTLPAGSYKFRADYQGDQYWGEETTLTAGQVAPVAISTGGGLLELTVTQSDGTPMTGISCYVFTESGSYLGLTAATDTAGKVSFALSDGTYKIRADYLGYRFWTDVITVPDTLSSTLAIPHRDCTVTVGVDYPAADVLAGVPVYLFTEAGSYMGRSLTTGADGTVVFSLPDQSYKVRADYTGGRFWSDPFQSADTSVTVPMAAAAITVTGMGEPLSGVNVYAFTAAGSYLGHTGTTNTAGQIAFTLPARSYKFRADYQGDRYWSDETALTHGQTTPVSIDASPLIASLTASPATILAGDPVTLAWSCSGATSCSISPDVGAVSETGSLQIYPDAATTYTLTATAAAGTVTDSVAVTVQALPAALDLGFGPDEYQGGGGLVGRTVRLLNGNALALRQDLSFASPNALGLSLAAVYNSQSDASGASGHGWTHTYETALETGITLAGRTFLKVTGPTGRAVYFYDEGADLYPGAFQEKSHVSLENSQYVWYRRDGSRYGFSSAGALQWIDDAKGNRLALTYDTGGRPATVTDNATGRSLTFTYLASGLVETVTGPVTAEVADGIHATYGYDANNNLTSVTYADGSGFDYTYADANDVHNLTAIHNKQGHQLATWGYDTEDRCIANFSPDGIGAAAVAYTSDSQVSVTDAYGSVRTYTLEPVSGRNRVTAMSGPAAAPYAAGAIVRWAYDSALNLVEIETVAGTVNKFQGHDSRGNPATVTLAYGTADQRTIAYTWHPDMAAPLTRTEASLLGTGSKVTTWDYDDDGDEIANEDPTALVRRVAETGYTLDISGTVAAYAYTTALTYNAAGQPLSVDGPLAGTYDTTTFTYDSTTYDLLTVTRPLVGTTTFAGYDAAGRPATITDVNGRTETLTYDARGRILTVTHSADGTGTSRGYNFAGQVTSTVDEDSILRTYDYESTYGRLAQINDYEGNYIEQSYDTRGNLIEKAWYGSDAVRSSVRRWSYDHPDLPGKLFQQINPDDTVTEFDYDAAGRLTSVTDAEDNETTYTYDALDRVIAAVQPGSVTTAFGYDAHGNRDSVTDPTGNETVYTFDDMGRVVRRVSPDSGTTAYTYDAAGNPAQKTDANGTVTTYTHDILGRLTAITFADSAQNITFTYDADADAVGRRTGMIDPSGTTTFSYDTRGRLTGKSYSIDAVTYTLGRGYTPAGRILSVTYPSGRTIDYDRSGCTCSVSGVTTTYSGTTTTLVADLSYRPFGAADGMTTGSGTVANQYDEAGRLTVANPGAPMERTYTYDNLGNLLTVSSPGDPNYDRAYTYDDLYRLTGAVFPWETLAYTYDNNGNRLTRTIDAATETYGYVTATNRLDSVTGTNTIFYGYDAAGKITGIDDRTLVYNDNDRLIRVEENGTVLGEYVYNGLGQRMKKTVDGVDTIYHWDLDDNIIAESNASGTFAKEYLYRHSGRLAMVDVSSGEFYFYLNDNLGTPQMLTDTDGMVVWEGIYRPFGETDVNPNSTVENNFRFAGQYFDAETGWHYNYHRYYDPSSGRYLRPDPIGLVGGVNLFAYARNNTINLSDPIGLQTFTIGGATPIPIILPTTPQQIEANQDIADEIWISWKKYIEPSVSFAGNFLYQGGLGSWVYDKLNPPKPIPDYVKNKQKLKESRLPVELKYGGTCEQNPDPEKDPCERLGEFIQSSQFKKLHPLKQFITIQMYTWGCR